MALEHLVDLEDLADEGVVVARVRDAHADEGADVVAHQARIEAGDVAEDGAALLQLAHAVGHRRLREADRVGDLHLGGLRVRLQKRQDLIIYLVKCHLYR